jgi:hypothetical protein
MAANVKPSKLTQAPSGTRSRRLGKQGRNVETL